MYSFTGGVLSFIAMVLVKELFKKHISSIGISVTGAVFHNVGQVLVAVLVLNNILIMTYLPVLVIVGTISGAFVGASTNYFLNHLERISFFKK
jgi:heptaprenyl diphosphate synthase